MYYGHCLSSLIYLDAFLDAHVVLVARVVLLGDHPVIAGEATALLQNLGSKTSIDYKILLQS